VARQLMPLRFHRQTLNCHWIEKSETYTDTANNIMTRLGTLFRRVTLLATHIRIASCDVIRNAFRDAFPAGGLLGATKFVPGGTLRSLYASSSTLPRGTLSKFRNFFLRAN